MESSIERQAHRTLGANRRSPRFARAHAIALAICLAPIPGDAGVRGHAEGNREEQFCSATAAALFRACGFEAQDDYWVATAKCINESDPADRALCYEEARATRDEDARTCREQGAGRLDACESIGEGRYDPDFDPGLFDHPKHPSNPNPYFPLNVGYKWTYGGANELNTVEVLNETKLIAGVTCIVLQDIVIKNGDLVEDTDDWYVPAKDGSVWYCGEEVKDYQSFDGDEPRKPELVSIDGSFKARRNRDKPGVIFQASPVAGRSYLEESSLGNAEDVTDILSTTYSYGVDPELDRLVPQQLVDLLCSGDCVVTRNFSLLEPGTDGRKYYAPQIGFFLEVKPDTGDVVQLVDCNFDSRCGSLPQP